MRGRLNPLFSIFLLICSILIFIFYWNQPVRAQTQPEIFFSEIAWAGSSISSADEWIELANATDRDVVLDGWVISRWVVSGTSGHEEDMVALSGTIHPNQFFVIGHKAHYLFAHGESVLATDPDFSTTSLSLSNNAFQLKLYQPTSPGRLLVDTAGNGGKPLAGSVEPKSSMLRRFPIGDGGNKDSWYNATTSDGFDPGVTDLGSPGLPNKSLPQITSTLCTPAILPKGLANFINCTGTIISYDGINVSATANITGLTIPLVIGSDGSWQLTKEINCDSQIFDLTLTAYSTNGLINTSIISLPCRQASNKIVISEVYPHGANGEEWIELHNESDAAIDLMDWTLDDIQQGGSKPYKFPQGTVLVANEYRTFDKTITKISLNDDGDSVVLSDPFGKIIDQTNYSKANEDYSWLRQNERAFVWTDESTKNLPNLLDERPSYSFDIHVSEFIPNPVGSDEEGEWIELYDNSDKVVDLSGWKIDDEEGGSTPFTVGINTFINPKDYLIFKRSQTNLALNNDSDEVRLFHPDGVLVEKIAYEKVTEGESYATVDNQWQWTDQPTLAAKNLAHTDKSTEKSEISLASNIGVDSSVQTQPSNNQIILAQVLKTEPELPIQQPREVTHIITPKADNNVSIDNGKIAGSITRRSTPLILLVLLFSGIIILVLFCGYSLWKNTLSIRSRSSKDAPKRWHPG